MHVRIMCSLLAAGALAGAAACDDVVFPLLPATAQFGATMTGAGESPPVTTAATGTGVFALVLDSIFSHRVDVVAIDSPTRAHIHLGPAGVNGAIIVTLFEGVVACTQNVDTALTIDSSSVGNPTTIYVAGEHGLTVASTPRFLIAGHSGSTPDLNGEHLATVTGDSTFTVPVNVTVAGTGGTAQRINRINVTAPACRAGFTGPLGSAQFKPGQLSQLPTAWGATARERLDSLLVLLSNGEAYVNVHNRANPAGHIRGQTAEQP